MSRKGASKQTTTSYSSDHTQRKIASDVPACLGTLLARIQLPCGLLSSPIRGFCDSGAQINIISEACVQRLRLRRTKMHVPICGMGTSTVSNGVVDLSLAHRTDPNIQIEIQAFIVKKVCGPLPFMAFESPFADTIADNALADPTFNQPGGIELLLGAGAWAAIIDGHVQQINQNNNHVVAQSTLFGWVIYGQIPGAKHMRLQNCTALIELEDARIDQLLLRYWNSEFIPQGRQWTAEEKRAEEIFSRTHRRDLQTGRYIVHVPLKQNAQPLGNSISTARACFYGVEKRLLRDPELYAKYKAVFDDYRELGHMVLAPERPKNIAESYYLPHHPINVSEGKGKFRIVFNASAETSTGVSYNAQQLAGPKLQDDLISIFLRFRARRFGMTADIRQMFRQVWVTPEQWNYQRVLWRDAPTEELREYVITVVCWGQTSAGFNAVRAVRQCAVDEEQNYPTGTRIAMNDLYYDDLLSGADSESEICIAYHQISQLLQTGGFKLAKWATNSKALATVLKDELHTEFDIPMDCGVLGMRWCPKTDSLRLKVANQIAIPDEQLTKRKVISETAKIYDPSGLVLPVIVTGKILQQDIWRSGIGWDDQLPPHLVNKWHEYNRSIADLDQITIPRWLQMGENATLQLHVFVDASEMAMGAVAYFRVTQQDGSTTMNLITSRSKVAPTKKVSTPRLELDAARLGARLAKFIRSTYGLSDIDVMFWTDSTIVVHWLKKNPDDCKPFVANRIIDIREDSENGVWRHINGLQNPADRLTRGITAAQLRDSSLWWNGPEWIINDPGDWPQSKVTALSPEMHAAEQAEMKTSKSSERKKAEEGVNAPFVGVARPKQTTGLGVWKSSEEFEQLDDRCSTLSTLLRVTAYVMRFVFNARRMATVRRESGTPIIHKSVPNCDRSTINAINSTERRQALLYWISHAQRTYYSDEMRTIREGKLISRKNQLVKLVPFIDGNGFLRVGGRLANANVSEGTKHQLILPPQARISWQIIRDAHFITIHGGPQLMLAHLRRTIWIPRMRQIIKSIVHKCTTCVRFDQPNNEQLMGNLPVDRVQQSPCFQSSGVDFAGPFIIRKHKGRTPEIDRCSKEPKCSTLKAWIVIFVCLSTRAVHVDVLLGLTIEQFFDAFERFCMRKGECRQLKSDNGTTFVGADKELARVLHQWSQTMPGSNWSKYGTKWSFISPAAPHKGGIWEAAVKSMKRHLKRSIGPRMLTKDELYQLATVIEGCLNSRPLWVQSDDPADPMPLTPAHFILAKPILPQPIAEDVADRPDNRLTAWGKRQKLHQQVWKRWQDEYLAERQVRHKWYRIKENLKVGDMVVVRKENTPPAMWVIGRVIEVLTNAEDGLVRAAIIKTPTGQLERPINKLIFLPQQDQISVDHPINGGDC